jgi:hypothetical protein
MVSAVQDSVLELSAAVIFRIVCYASREQKRNASERSVERGTRVCRHVRNQ